LRYSFLWGLAAGLLVLLAAGCAAASDEGGSVPVYTVSDTTGDWGFPSPYAHYSRGPGYVRMSLLFDTLIWKDDEGYVPALAESWEMEGDDVYIFHLRDGITWHDGEPFTADDVVFTIDYTKEHPYQWVDSSVIENAEALDDLTVKITLPEPYAPFLELVAGTLPILPQHIWAEIDDPINYRDQEGLVGTGPYTLDIDDYDQVQGTYRYVANEDYYLGSPKVKELRFVKISAPNAATELIQGNVNTADIDPEMIDLLGDDFVILSVPAQFNYKLMINHQKEPMSDKEFRQALAYAIDRDKLVEIAARGYGTAGSPGLIPPDNDWYNPEMDDHFPHDIAKAEELLDEAGYDGQQIELLVQGGDATSERIGEQVEEDLESVGIDVYLRTMESKTIDSKIREWDFDLAVSGHGGLIGDPNFLASNINDMYSFCSARYDDNSELNDLLVEQVTETDEDTRRDIIYEAQVLYAEDVPALSLYYPSWYCAHDGQVDLYYTYNGMASGIPIAQNKLSFVGV
jgi:peptide/nickel transport system substrate-binding protein